ncbi:MAG: hypothetical protein H7293_17375 [Candidatus Saccharibacteria bacterium]|nr:hypothetical protein [Rhodoferax sp.]
MKTIHYRDPLHALSYLWALATALGLAFSTPAAVAANPASPQSALTAEQAQEDVGVLLRSLRALHPALHKYRSPAEMDPAFTGFQADGSAARTAGAMYLAATELAAAIRCGHTWTNVRNQAGAARSTLLDGQDKLPMTMTLVEGRWLVLASADAAVRTGDEVTAINGLSTGQHVTQLMPYLRADGSSDGKRLRQLSHDRPDTSQVDILLPLLSPPVDGAYQLNLRIGDGSSKTLRVPATTLAAREQALKAQGVSPLDEGWKFQIKGQAGTLVLPSFSFWNSKFDWSGFLDNAFAQLNAQKVPFLVIDIRNNEGGDGAIGNKLLSHLIRQPLGYYVTQSVTTYERVPPALLPYLDTWDTRFFDRSGDVEPINTGTAKGKFQLKSRPPVQRFIAPAGATYAGTTYTLVSAENSSATFVLADLLQRSGAATLVGQPTGGNQRGLNGGQLAWVKLPHSGVAVDIPLLAARYEENTLDASVTPDVLVVPSFAARLAGTDQEMQAVNALIAARKLDAK